MSVFPGSSNAIVYAQFNLQGRWKRMLIAAGGYGLLLSGAVWLTFVLNQNFRPRDLEGWVVGLLGLQCANLLVFGVYRVESAVRGDVLSRMIESHRLMPSPPLGSILGYVFGAPLQAFLFAIVNFCIGAYCCFIAGLSGQLWTLGNAILLFYSIAVYAVVAQFAFFARGGFLLFLIVAMVAITSAANEILQTMPSLAVLFTPLLSNESIFPQIFGRTGGSPDVMNAYLTAMVATAIVAMVAIRVGIRRYRSSNVIGITAPLGLVLLFAWVGLAVAQMRNVDLFNYSRFHSYRHDDAVGEVIFSFISSLLLATFPIASAARATARPPGDSIAPTNAIRIFRSQTGTVVLATTILSLLLLDIPTDVTGQSSCGLLTLVIELNFLIAIACTFYWGYLIRSRAWVLAGIWIVVTWLGPVMIDAIVRAESSLDTKGDDWTSIVSISPAGALGLIWSDSHTSVLPGIVGQIALTLIPAGILQVSKRRRTTSNAQAALAT